MNVEGKVGPKDILEEKSQFHTEDGRVTRVNDQVNFKHILLKLLLALRDRKSEGVNLSFVKLEFEIPARWILINRGITEFFIIILRFK